jgi:hypothetical protein
MTPPPEYGPLTDSVETEARFERFRETGVLAKPPLSRTAMVS